MTTTRVTDPRSGLSFDVETYEGPIGPPIEIILCAPKSSLTNYVCDGCGRKTTNPAGDLADLHAKGFVSCCPERKMIAQ